MITTFDQKIVESLNNWEVNGWPVGNLILVAIAILLSVILCGMVGIEREWKGRSAGLRTHLLVGVGSCIIMIISIYGFPAMFGDKRDVARLAAQIITGVGFLGAGAIIQMKGSVRGLTTAAGMWMTASIGLAVGAGMYVVAVTASVLIILVLTLLELCEKRLFKGREQKIVRLKVDYIVKDASPFRQFFSKHNVHISDEFLRYDYTQETTIINFMVRSHDKTDFIKLFDEIHGSGNVLSLTLTNEVNN